MASRNIARIIKQNIDSKQWKVYTSSRESLDATPLDVKFTNFTAYIVIIKNFFRNNKKRKNLGYYFITCIFPNIKLKSGFRISCSVRKKLFENSTSTALAPNLLGISTFLGFLNIGRGGGNLNGVTAMWRPIYLYLNFYR